MLALGREVVGISVLSGKPCFKQLISCSSLCGVMNLLKRVRSVQVCDTSSLYLVRRVDYSLSLKTFEAVMTSR